MSNAKSNVALQVYKFGEGGSNISLDPVCGANINVVVHIAVISGANLVLEFLFVRGRH